MNADQLNIDDFVDYAAEYRSMLKNFSMTGDRIMGRCPFHDDRQDSFTADAKTGMCHCFTGCIDGNFISFSESPAVSILHTGTICRCFHSSSGTLFRHIASGILPSHHLPACKVVSTNAHHLGLFRWKQGKHPSRTLPAVAY